MAEQKRLLRTARFSLIFILALAAALLPPRAAWGASVGNQWNYTLVHQVEIKNLGSTPARSISVEVPLADLDGEYLYCQSVGTELSPYPLRIVSDGSGRRCAVFTIDRLAAGQAVTLTQRYALKVGAVSYERDPEAEAAAYSSAELELLAPYLQPTDRIQSDAAAIAAFVNTHTEPEADLYEKARSLFSAVNLTLDYSTAATDQSSLATLNRKSGSCEGYVNLYLACLRAAGVACRQVSGYLYQPAVHISDGYVDPRAGDVFLDRLRHTWAEFYLPGEGWLPADPTFTYTFTVDGVEKKFVNWSYFANVSPANRYVCFRRGDTTEDKIRLLSATGGQVDIAFSARLSAGLNYTPFNDIAGHWAEESIRYCVENGLFNGVSAQSFAPETAMTRAMFVTVLGRLYEKRGGALPQGGLSSFSDVKPGSYYQPYLAWATENGIIRGYGNGRFGPDDPVTREQMATIMAAFLSATGYADQVAPGSAAVFADAGRISGWAREGVDICLERSLLSGYPDGCFHPDYQATRAQVAAILQRLERWLAGQPG